VLLVAVFSEVVTGFDASDVAVPSGMSLLAGPSLVPGTTSYYHIVVRCGPIPAQLSPKARSPEPEALSPEP